MVFVVVVGVAAAGVAVCRTLAADFFIVANSSC